MPHLKMIFVDKIELWPIYKKIILNCTLDIVSVAWVLFPAEIPSPEEEFVQKYANEIDRQLLQLGINKSTMEKVPLNLPFHPSIPVSKS